MPRKTDASPATPVININTSAPASSPENEKTETPREEKPPNWFFTELADKPAHEWGRVWSLELHRLKPDVPGVPGTKGYLRLFSEPVTLETIRSNFGGGRFRLNLCKNGRWHTSHEFEIEGQPKYDPNRELPATNGNNGNGAGGNIDGNVLKVLEQQNERLYQVLTTLQGAKEENPAISSAVDILTSAYKTGLTAVAGQPGGSSGDATKQLETVLSLAEKIVSIGGGNRGGGGLTEAIQLLTSLGVISKPKTLAEQIADAQSLKELMGGGDAPPKDWRAAAVQAVTNHLPEILDTFKTTSANTVAANQARARAAEVIRGAAPAAVPAAAPANPAPAAAAAPAPPVHSNGGLRLVPRDSVDETPVQQGAPAETATASPISVEEHRHALKINVVNLFMHGASGSSIASYVEDVDPEFAADFGKYTTDQIISFFATDEILKVMVDSMLPPSDPTFPTRLHEVLADAREFVTEGAALPVN